MAKLTHKQRKLSTRACKLGHRAGLKDLILDLVGRDNYLEVISWLMESATTDGLEATVKEFTERKAKP